MKIDDRKIRLDFGADCMGARTIRKDAAHRAVGVLDCFLNVESYQRFIFEDYHARARHPAAFQFVAPRERMNEDAFRSLLAFAQDAAGGTTWEIVGQHDRDEEGCVASC